MSTSMPQPNVSDAWKVWVGSIVSVVLATIAVSARLAARRISAAKFWWDDFTIILALMLTWGMSIIRWIMLTQYHYGHHIEYVGKHNVIRFWKAFMGVQVLYFTNAALTKISLLLLYHRIFGVVKNFRIALWVSSFLVLGYWIACTVLAFLGCQPLQKNFDKTVPGHCVDLINFFRWNGICNLLIDFLILLLPLPMVWHLNIALRQKISLSAIFGLGIFVCVTSILRVLAYNPQQVKDGTFSTVGTVTWSSVEQGLGIVCACLPTLRPLFTHAHPNSTSKSKSSSSHAMDTFRSNNGTKCPTPHRESVWREDGSTVGFARLRDEETVMSPMELQRSVYGNVGTAVTTTAGEGERKESNALTMGIMKEVKVDQRSDFIGR